MNTTLMENRSSDTGAFGGMLDAVGGIATAALAIIALAGLAPDVLMAIATIVFGATLIVQAGALVSELSGISASVGAIAASPADSASGGGVGVMFLVGISGIVLGILALLGINPLILCAAALIAFGAALLLGSGSVRNVHQLQAAVRRSDGVTTATTQTADLLANEMAAGSASAQLLSGISAIVLGIVALSGVYPATLVLVGLLVIGASNILAGGALSGMMLGSTHRERTTATIR